VLLCCRLVLCCLTPSARWTCSRKKARDDGISDEAIEEANDAADQKSAFIALLLDA
jgi:hypothetical protein